MKSILLFCIILSLAMLSSGCVGQMFYYPDHKVYKTVAAFGLKFEEATFYSKDGTKLSGWFVPAKGVAKGTVIHFHGNAQNMTAHFDFVSWLPAEGFNIFVFDYRGYGKSAGRQNRKGVYEDSLAAIDYVRSRKDVQKDKLLIFGQSLGGAQAITAVGSGNKQGVRAVVVESTFFSYRSIVRDKIGAMPLLSLLKTPLSYLLIGDDLSPADYVEKLAPVPLLLVYGTADDIIPYHHGPQLLESAKQPKTFWRIEGGEHIEAFVDASSPYRRRLVDFFEQALVDQPIAKKL
jgi:uncharacterized protein